MSGSVKLMSGSVKLLGWRGTAGAFFLRLGTGQTLPLLGWATLWGWATRWEWPLPWTPAHRQRSGSPTAVDAHVIAASQSQRFAGSITLHSLFGLCLGHDGEWADGDRVVTTAPERCGHADIVGIGEKRGNVGTLQNIVRSWAGARE